MQLDPSLQAGFFTTWKKLSSHVPGIHQHYHSYLVSLLFAAPIPTLVIFVKCLPLVEIFEPVYNIIITMLHQKSSDTRTHTHTASANTALSHR